MVIKQPTCTLWLYTVNTFYCMQDVESATPVFTVNKWLFKPYLSTSQYSGSELSIMIFFQKY